MDIWEQREAFAAIGNEEAPEVLDWVENLTDNELMGVMLLTDAATEFWAGFVCSEDRGITDRLIALLDDTFGEFSANDSPEKTLMLNSWSWGLYSKLVLPMKPIEIAKMRCNFACSIPHYTALVKLTFSATCGII